MASDCRKLRLSQRGRLRNSKAQNEDVDSYSISNFNNCSAMDNVVSVVVDMFNVCILQERNSSERLESNLGFR
jgi:hypothetical protein